MTTRIVLRTLVAGLLLASAVHSGAARPNDGISLDGDWRFQLDQEDAGIQENWAGRSLPDRMRLPGTLSAQGIGDEVSLDTKWIGGIVDRSFFESPEYEKYRQPGNVKVPFWLQPDKYYAGAAWYQRDVTIPNEWRGNRVVLFLERPHWETRVWIDGKLVGTNNALGTPHEFDLGSSLSPGKHTLTVRVDNRMVIDIGENSHSVSDHTQGNWNGIVGRIRLKATPPVWLEDLQVYPQTRKKSVIVKGVIGNATGQPGEGQVDLAVKPGADQRSIFVSWQIEGGRFETELPLGNDAMGWSEFSPVLHRLTATLNSPQDPGVRYSRSVTFGLREIATEGTQFVLNGRKIFIRGTLDCAIYPLTGHPPVDVESWRRVIRTAKAHGLNTIRFHSWCPPEAAFIAADELGFYYQVECSSWPNQSTTLGDGKPVDRWIYEEADRILKAYGNHPSFLLLAAGNEPGGDHHRDFLSKWVSHYRNRDSRRLYSSGAGWPELPENQFHLIPDPRIQQWGEGLASRINARPPETRTDYEELIRQRNVPVVSHEIGQWCVYPNFEEIPKYTGYLKPKNFEVFRERLQANGMADLARPFLMASGKLQTLCYKEDIESALRTPGMAGFQLLDLHDFPGQGTALVGVLDPFWDSKGYVTPEEFARFCNRTVPLVRLEKRVFTTAEDLQADVEIAHFGAEPLEKAGASWKLLNEAGQPVASGRLPDRDIPVGNGVQLGKITVPLNELAAPARYRLALSVGEFENDWDVWVYPEELDTSVPAGINLTSDLNAQTEAALEKGGKVLLLLAPSKVAPDPKLGKVELGFSSIFWNTAWTKRQAPHTLGILCDPQHPALAGFPTEYHSNWQWWYLVSRAGAMILDELPREMCPTVQVIDDWFTARRLGLLLEARVGQGRLMVCSIDFENGLDANPVARQFRHSLLSYMRSEKFDPQTSLTVQQVRGLMISGHR